MPSESLRHREPSMSSQERVLQYVEEYIDENGYSPSVREIMEGCGWASPSTPHFALEKLAAKGLITWNPQKPRTIRMVQTPRVQM